MPRQSTTAGRTGHRQRGKLMVLALAGMLTIAGSASRAEDALPDAADPFMLLRAAGPVMPVNDWLAVYPDVTLRPFPDNGSVVRRSPPTFRWPFDDKIKTWSLRISLDGAVVSELTSETNWLQPDLALTPGIYTWQLRAHAADGNTTPWSGERRFTVPRNAEPAVIVDTEKALATATNQPRPRSLANPDGEDGVLHQVRDGYRQAIFQRYLDATRVALLGVPPLDEPERADDPDLSLQEQHRRARHIASSGFRATRAALISAYAWLGSGDDNLLAETMNRVRQLAAWDPRGSTGLRSNDVISREIALVLSLILDLTYEQWPQEERNRLIDGIVERVEDLHRHFVGDGAAPPLRRVPYNSHGFRQASAIAAIASLLAGERPEAARWFRTTLPLVTAIDNPWGGEDGGFANGLAYAGWNLLAHLRHWDILSAATGLPYKTSAWLSESVMYLSYFAPAGSVGVGFGDGADANMREVWTRAGHMLRQRFPGPFSERYAASWSNDSPLIPEIIFGPLNQDPTAPAARRPRLPDAAVFPSIGWAAMHSDLDDPARTSVYFQSSPYGSYNHSHAAQNSFILYARGRPLLAGSGFYDSYGSAHHNGWSRTTKAQNAITYDGGQGQAINSLTARGRIVAFHHRPDIDVVAGEAAAAYGNGIAGARRTLAYLRPGTLLVYDRMSADRPRQWEWNWHSRTQMLATGNNRIAIPNHQASVCVEQIAGTPTQLTLVTGFPVAPDRTVDDDTPPWRGRYTSAPEKDVEFLFLLRLDCDATAVADVRRRPSGGFDLTLDGRALFIDGDGAAFLTNPAGG